MGKLEIDDSSTSDDTGRLWRCIWNLSVPLKLRHFLWRACTGSLATKQILYNRYCVFSPVCDRCSCDPETILHAICDCPENAAIWSPFSLAAVHSGAPRSSVMEFLLWVKAHSSPYEFRSCCTSLWAGWFMRYKTLFTSKICDPIVLNISSHKLVQDYTYFTTNTHSSSVEPLLRFQV